MRDTFSHNPDAEAVAKTEAGKDNPLYRAWKNETPDADQQLEDWMNGQEENPQGDVLKTHFEAVRHVGGSEMQSGVEGIPGRSVDIGLGEKMRETQSIADVQAAKAEAERQAQIAMQGRMIEAEYLKEEPYRNLSEGSIDEKGFDYRGVSRREETTRGMESVSLPTGRLKGWWNKLRGRTEQPSAQNEKPTKENEEFKKAA